MYNRACEILLDKVQTYRGYYSTTLSANVTQDRAAEVKYMEVTRKFHIVPAARLTSHAHLTQIWHPETLRYIIM